MEASIFRGFNLYTLQDMSINCISPKHRVVTLDYSGSSLATTSINKNRCNSSDSSSDIPGMVPSVSTQSCSSEVSETDSISTASRAQGAQSPRSIFQRFWTSPTHTKSLEQSVDDKEEEEALLERLSTLQLPSANETGECSTSSTAAKVVYPTDRHKICNTSAAAVEDVVDPKASRITRKKSIDDMSIGYQAVPTPPSSTRRQILPTPPPQQLKPYPTQSKQDQLSHNVVSRGSGERNWSSTGELLSRRPSQSCLRKTRYSSCTAIDDAELLRQLHEEDQKGMPLKKSRSVSFYSEVSVFEFNVVKDEIRSQEGWSKYFA